MKSMLFITLIFSGAIFAQESANNDKSETKQILIENSKRYLVQASTTENITFDGKDYKLKVIVATPIEPEVTLGVLYVILGYAFSMLCFGLTLDSFCKKTQPV